MNITTSNLPLRGFYQLLVLACLGLIALFGFVAGTVSFALIAGVLITTHWLAHKLRHTRSRRPL